MIETKGLTKVFDSTVAVDHFDLLVEPGEILGLVGINGAGKTTFLRMLSGIIQPTDGEVMIAGHALAGPRLEGDGVAARHELAFVPDTPMLFDALTVQEHLLFVADLYSVNDREARFDALLAEFELTERRHSTASSLSRGMRQKLAICCAFLHDPKALLLDEPLTGLDPPGRKRMFAAIKARAALGSAVIISSHQLEFVEKLCTRIAIVHQGQLRLSGSLAEIQQLAAREGGSLEDVFLSAIGVHDGSEESA
ncbi:MAG: ABC-2 type transport system ATP-binding protein, partial [Pseudohongiellaceae bacterium]